MEGLTLSRTPELIAAEINLIKDRTRQVVINSSIEIGRKLTEAKELVPHGEWGNWLEEAVDYSKSTANNLMKIFQEYGADQLTLLGDNAKSQAFGKLTYSQAVLLLGVPAEQRENFIEENNVEEMSTRELKKRIEEVTKLKKQLKDEKEKTKSIKGQLEEIRELKDALQRRYDEDIEKSKEEIEEKEAEIRELESKPIEVNSADKEELDKLKKEVEQLQEEVEKAEERKQDDAVIRYSVYFNNIVNEFNNLLGSLEQIKKDEEKTQFSNATKQLLSMMQERL